MVSGSSLSLVGLTVAAVLALPVVAQGQSAEEPLVGPGCAQRTESWSQHPLSVGGFAGVVQGGPLMDDWVGMEQGFLGGYQLGADFGSNVGIQMRFAFGSIELYDTARAKEAQWDADTAAGYPTTSLWRHRFDHAHYGDLFQWDIDGVFYPCGDTPLRPYIMIGAGATSVRFTDRLALEHHQMAFSLPLGVGVKYLCTDRMAVRLDCVDDVAFFSGELNPVHNVSLTGGVELRFGGARRGYWPWNPGRSYW